MSTTTYASYQWNTGANTQEITVTSPDEYTVTVTDANGCTGNATGTFSVYAKPVIDTPIDQTACEGSTITLSPVLPIGSYEWKPNGETTSSIQVTQDGDYEVVVTNAGGCKDSVSINASFNAMPAIDLGPDRIICEGETANIGFDGIGSTVSWDIGLVADFIDVQTTGLYEATITDGNGCSGKDTIGVTVSHNPTPVASNDTVVCMQEIGTLPLTVAAGIRDVVTWNTGETENDIIIDVEGTYTVTAVNGDGCIGHDTVQVDRKCVSSIWIPNAFTPDQDGINDFFGPKGINITDFDFYVFNRWGEQIFHSTDMDDKWDGTYMGRECQIDVYVWKLYYRTEEDYGGWRREQQVGTCTLYR